MLARYFFNIFFLFDAQCENLCEIRYLQRFPLASDTILQICLEKNFISFKYIKEFYAGDFYSIYIVPLMAYLKHK